MKQIYFLAWSWLPCFASPVALAGAGAAAEAAEAAAGAADLLERRSTSETEKKKTTYVAAAFGLASSVCARVRTSAGR